MNPLQFFVDYSRLNRGSAHEVLQPSDAATASAALRHARDQAGPNSGVTIGGSGRSFGLQALPPEHLQRRVLIRTTALGGITKLPISEEDHANHVRRVVVGAGVTFGEMLAALEDGQHGYIPFSTPTSKHITVAGALAANAHSRTTAAKGGYLFDHVKSFALITPDLGSVMCRRDAPETSLSRRLFAAAPGSFGALGVITDVEIELRIVPKDATVYCGTLHVSDGIDDFANAFRTLSATNKNGGDWDEGVFALLYGSPSRGRASIMGCKTGSSEDAGQLSAMPLFDDRPVLNSYCHGIGNGWPRVATYMTARTFKQGAAYLNKLLDFSYFLTSHDEAHTRLLSHEPIATAMRWLHIIDPDLPTAHQAWVLPPASLNAFMRCAGALLDGPFSDILPRIELQDVLMLPHSDTLMSPCTDSVNCLYAFAFAAPDKGGPKTQRARAFFRALSTAAADPAIGARVYLLKESHCDDALLRSMHAPALHNLRELKTITDSRNVLTSGMLTRLLDVHGTAADASVSSLR